MSRVTSWLNRVLALVLLLASGARLAVARMFPPTQLTRTPSNANVFALSETAWQELRGSAAAGAQERDESRGVQQESSKKQDEPKEPPKDSSAKEEPPKSAECPKSAPHEGGENKSSQSDEKKKDAKPECDGPGGGDGDMGGTGG